MQTQSGKNWNIRQEGSNNGSARRTRNGTPSGGKPIQGRNSDGIAPSQINVDALDKFLELDPPRSLLISQAGGTDSSGLWKRPAARTPAVLSTNDEAPYPGQGDKCDPLSVWKIRASATGVSALVLEDWAMNSSAIGIIPSK